MGLKEGFTVYDEAGKPVSNENSNSANISSSLNTGTHNQGGDKGGEDNGESLVLGPPAGSDVDAFKEFFDGLVRMENKYRASEKLGELRFLWDFLLPTFYFPEVKHSPSFYEYIWPA